MSINPSIEPDRKRQIAASFHRFEQSHKEEIEAVSLILAKITNRTPAEIKPRLDTMLAELVEPKEPSSFNSEQWDEDMKMLAEGADKIPVLPTEAFTRESIYGDHD
jgi:hypothetical protein